MSAAQERLHFAAIHCDPGSGAAPELQYENLERMVARADQLSMRLTIMLTPQWADYISAAPARTSALDEWRQRGHEIAGHHHSVYHPGTWDGYSDLTEAERAQALGPRGRLLEHTGSLVDLENILLSLIPDLISGCANGETDKRSIPASFRYDTCPGFYTSYSQPLGTRLDGSDPLAGQNDFMLSGWINGREHLFLNHGLISAPFIAGSKAAYDAYEQGVWGVVVHTKDADVSALDEWLTHVAGAPRSRSVTVREAVESNAVPTLSLDPEVFLMVWLQERP